MTPGHSVDISIADADFCKLVAEALHDNIVSNYCYNLAVKNVVNLGGRWTIAYIQTKKEPKK